MKINSLTKLLLTLLCILSLLSLISCGSGGGGGGAGDAVQTSDVSIKQGQFLDSAVEGIQFVSGDQSGITDASGIFSYEDGATIQFFIGDIVIGQVTGKSIITPVDLVQGAEDETNPTVTNICRFLLALDNDQNPDNGITITEMVRNNAVGKSVIFDEENNLQTVINQLMNGRTLVSSQYAQNHLKGTLLAILSGAYSGTFTGDDSGTWTINIDSSGSLSGSGFSNSDGNFTIAGNLSSNGELSAIAGTTSIGSTFTGNIFSNGRVNGTWDNSYWGERGSFSGSKVSGSGLSQYIEGTIYKDFALTEFTFNYNSNWDQIVQSIFGSQYRVADWNDLKKYYNDGGDLLELYDGLGLADYDSYAYVKKDGDPSYSNSRYYFAARHEGHLPTDYVFLAHDNVGNYIVSLGSWYGSGKILAVRNSFNGDNIIDNCENIAGIWDITEIADERNCGEGITTYYLTAQFTQNGCSVTINTSRSATGAGTINSNSVSFNISGPEDGGTTNTSGQFTISGNNLSGNASWTWRGGGSCSGTSQISGTKRN